MALRWAAVPSLWQVVRPTTHGRVHSGVFPCFRRDNRLRPRAKPAEEYQDIYPLNFDNDPAWLTKKCC